MESLRFASPLLTCSFSTQSSGKHLESRMSVIDYENEVLARRERERRKQAKIVRVGGRNGGGAAPKKSETVTSAEDEVRECWELIEELKKGLYK